MSSPRDQNPYSQILQSSLKRGSNAASDNNPFAEGRFAKKPLKKSEDNQLWVALDRLQQKKAEKKQMSK